MLVTSSLVLPDSTTKPKMPQFRDLSLSDHLVALTRSVVKFEDDLSQIQNSVSGQTETFVDLNRAQYSIPTRFDSFTREQAKSKARLILLEDVPTTTSAKLHRLPLLPLLLFPFHSMLFRLRSMLITAITHGPLQFLHSSHFPAPWLCV